MFQVNREQNRLTPLNRQRFDDLKLRERAHLQEWLANMPEALGEDLLIIQKEFDGFADTRERLDLLALDKSGRLVIIENKLDDSGRDVTWQALKYCAYCSSLSKAQIVDIYQSYLDRYRGGENATQNICDFLNITEFDDITLNPGSNQRVIFIAANFRKEVTATVLWLIDQGIQAQCIKVTPYSFGDDLIIDVRQIIPPPEAADYMISMASKEAAEKSTQVLLQGRYKIRLEFWEQALTILRENGVTLFQNISPSKDNWLNAGSGLGSCPFVLVLLKTGVRVELCLSRPNKEENKWLFDQLVKHKDDIEKNFGQELDWQRLDERISCRICLNGSFDGFNRDNWPEMCQWMLVHIQKLQIAFSPYLIELSEALRQHSPTDESKGISYASD